MIAAPASPKTANYAQYHEALAGAWDADSESVFLASSNVV